MRRMHDGQPEEAAETAEIHFGSSGKDIFRRFVDTISFFMLAEKDEATVRSG